MPAEEQNAQQANAANPPQPQQPTNGRNPLDWMNGFVGTSLVQHVAMGTFNTLRPMQTRNAPAPISTRQPHHPEVLQPARRPRIPEVLQPVEAAPASNTPSSSNQFVAGRSVSQTEVRQRHAELERELSDLDRSPNASGTYLAQSTMDFDMVQRNEAPKKVEGLWSPNHPAQEHATPAATRAGWLRNRPGSFTGSSPKSSVKND